jgi:putative transposase
MIKKGVIMPSRNSVYRQDAADCYYHVYGRGMRREEIFMDEQDYKVFINLLKRYFGAKPDRDNQGRLRKNYHNELELLAFCLMPNHFHLLFHQIEKGAIAKAMQGIILCYGKYFNHKHKKYGSLLESRYKSSLILDDNYLIHASRYIHLNPDDYENWSWSSLPYYTRNWSADWIKPSFIESVVRANHYLSYKKFVDEYKTNRDKIKRMKSKYLEEYDEPSRNYYTNPVSIEELRQ